MEGADQLSFYDGDRIGQCQLLRRADGDRHCIVAFFTIKRGFGRLDAFVAGTGSVKQKLGVTEAFMEAFFEDMKKTSLSSYAAAPYPVGWETLDFQGCSTPEEDVVALQRAGVQIWTDTPGPQRGGAAG